MATRWIALSCLAPLVACSGTNPPPTDGPVPAGQQPLDGNAANVPRADAGVPLVCTGALGATPYSKYKSAFFGNLHQHTGYSLDALTLGTRATPADAYEFAKGRKWIHIGAATSAAPGPWAHLDPDKALDFLAVTDHSEFLGIVKGCNDATNYPQLYAQPDCARVRSTNVTDQSWTFPTHVVEITATLCGAGSATAAECDAATKSAWQDEIDAATNAYVPCRFTSLVAYEWTSTPQGLTNHRNVIFGSLTVPAEPFDSNDNPTLGDLFAKLEGGCTGACQALAIPHNTNLSSGTSLLLPEPANRLSVESLSKYQKLVEVFQHKGSSECFADPANPDPACSFEYVTPPATGDTPQSYVRQGLGSGLKYALDHGTANPMKMGIYASTDDHNGIAGLVAEDAFAGHAGRLDDSSLKRLLGTPEFNPGGLAGVWATENTRPAIFEALNTKETFGTSGPRIRVRMFQTKTAAPCTADFPKPIVDAGDAIAMGGTVHPADLGGRPLRLAIAAWPDGSPQPLADGTKAPAGLDRVQILKAHIKAGETAVTYEAPVDLPIDAGGACVVYDAQRDPHGFDAQAASFYYVRVLQQRTFRWSHFDCQDNPTLAACANGKLDTTVQERAWSSPIWFEP